MKFSVSYEVGAHCE